MPRAPSRPQSTLQSIRPDFTSRLLTHLRTTFASPELEYTEPPQAITGGFDTLTYGLALGGGAEEICRPLILRVFRTEHPSAVLKSAERVRLESVIQNTIGRLGYPAPRVRHTWTDADIIGAPFLLMDRLPGHIMLDLFSSDHLESGSDSPTCSLRLTRGCIRSRAQNSSERFRIPAFRQKPSDPRTAPN